MINRGAGTNGDLAPPNLTKFSILIDLNLLNSMKCLPDKINSGGVFLCVFKKFGKRGKTTTVPEIGQLPF